MEYEIGDDPQGLTDRSETYRDGGLRDDGMFFRRSASAETGVYYDDAIDEGPLLTQFGEPA